GVSRCPSGRSLAATIWSTSAVFVLLDTLTPHAPGETPKHCTPAGTQDIHQGGHGHDGEARWAGRDDVAHGEPSPHREDGEPRRERDAPVRSVGQPVGRGGG